MKLPSVKTDKPHPLEDVVLKAFTKMSCQDASSLSGYLAGADGGCLVIGDHGAYYTVAKDVLGYMQCQGKLKRDSQGWWRVRA